MLSYKERQERIKSTLHVIIGAAALVMSLVAFCLLAYLVGCVSVDWMCDNMNPTADLVRQCHKDRPIIMMGICTIMIVCACVAIGMGVYTIYFMVYCAITMIERKVMINIEAPPDKQVYEVEKASVTPEESEKWIKDHGGLNLSGNLALMAFEVVNKYDRDATLVVFSLSFVLSLVPLLFLWYKTSIFSFLVLPVAMDLARLILLEKTDRKRDD